MADKPMTKTALKVLFRKAQAAGDAAAKAVVPALMVVEQHSSPFNDASPVVQRWRVPDGVCGFAWVRIVPGNCRAAHVAKDVLDARKAYNGGVTIWCSAYNQSLTRKEEWATAFAKVLCDAGIDAYAESRMD